MQFLFIIWIKKETTEIIANLFSVCISKVSDVHVILIDWRQIQKGESHGKIQID